MTTTLAGAADAFSPYLQGTPVAAQPVSAEQTIRRIGRLCRRAIMAMRLDLRDLTVLTEAATGPFAVTPIIAALAGAGNVVAVTRDSRWGRAEDAIDQVRRLAEHEGLAGAIRFSTDAPHLAGRGCDIVTNLGFVRPIDRNLIAALSPSAAISLMWEPWEFRPGEIDLGALRDHEVALIATNEGHPEVRTFEYLGPTVGRLLLEAGVELVNARLIVLGSDPFGAAIAGWLTNAGASVTREWPSLDRQSATDALIVAEHRSAEPCVDSGDHDALQRLSEWGAPVIRLCGSLDEGALADARIHLHPNLPAARGVMAVTTAYAGPRPVIDLHAAGLKAAQVVVHARRAGASLAEAIGASVADGYGLALPHWGAQ